MGECKLVIGSNFGKSQIFMFLTFMLLLHTWHHNCSVFYQMFNRAEMGIILQEGEGYLIEFKDSLTNSLAKERWLKY